MGSMLRIIKFLPVFFLGLWLTACCQNTEEERAKRLVILYSDKADPHTLNQYDLLVFDTEKHPDLNRLKPEQIALGYVSIGEAKPGFLTEAQRYLSVSQHPHWQSDRVDIRQAEWREIVVDQLVPQALAQGFDGVMLDTADTPLYLEATEPERFSGMKEATLELIKRIRTHFPNAIIMLNRGKPLWNEAAAHLDMLLIESSLTHYDLASGHHRMQEPEIYQQWLTELAAVKQQHPMLELYSVDYWDTQDAFSVGWLAALQRWSGITPYIAEPALNRIYPNPEPHALCQPFSVLPLGDRHA